MIFAKANIQISFQNKNIAALIAALALLLVVLAACGSDEPGADPSDMVAATSDPAPEETASQAPPEAAPQVDDDPAVVTDNQQQEGIEPADQAAPQAEEQAETQTVDRSDSQPQQEIKPETRALWARQGVRNRKITKQEINDLVAQVDQAGLNVILFAVYTEGTAYFEPSRSRFPDEGERLTNQSNFEDKTYSDTLSYLLEIRDKRRADPDPFNDFEVHAWFNVHRGGDQENGWPPEAKTEPHMLNVLFPEFRLKYGEYYTGEDERFVSHEVSVVQQPRFRAYMTNLIAGLVEDYDVDGVHLDHIRTGGICFNNEALDYPGTEYDYPGCQEDYRAWTKATYGQEYSLWDDTQGFKEIRDGDNGRVAAWLANAMDMLVQSIHDEVKKVKSDAVISVASVRNDTSRTNMGQLINGQYAWEWLEKGWIDVIFVTAYSDNTQAVVNKVQAVRDAVQDPHLRSRVFPGLITYNTDDPNSLWSDLIITQVDAVLFGRGSGQPLEPPARGVALFRSVRLDEAAVRALGEGPFREPALPFWGD